jgi:hypothetical protein
MAVRAARRDRFWRFVLLALAIVPVPAALARDDYHAPRTALLPVCLCVLAVPAVDALLRRARAEQPWRVVAATLAALAVAQAVWFQAVFWRDGPNRGEAFEAGIEDVLKTALLSSPDGRVFVYMDDKRARTQVEWQARVLGRQDAVVRAGAGSAALPSGSVLVARDHACTGCRLLVARGAYGAFVTG